MNGVGFVNPWAIWLAAGAAVPVIIHLLLRQKPRTVNFPLVRLIVKSQTQVMRRNRLRHIILLLMRMAVIVLFAMLIVRPAPADQVKGLRGGGPPVEETSAVVLIVDDSLSMRYRREDRTHFDEARDAALEVLDRVPNGAVVGVLTTSPMSGKLVVEHATARSALEDMEATSGSSDVWGALANAAEMLSRPFATRKVFLFTDMTEAAWRNYSSRDLLELGDQVELYVVPAGTGVAANGAITDVYHEGQPAMTGSRFDINVRVLASDAPMKRSVQLEFDGRPVGRYNVDLPAGQESEVTFLVDLKEPGFHWGRASFVNPDALVQDDLRHFTVNVTRQINVLVVDDDPEADGPDSASYFVRWALVPPGTPPTEGTFSIRRATPGGLAGLWPDRADVVVLAAPANMTDAAWRALSEYVRRGGGVLAFAGPQALGESWNTEAAQALLGVEIGEVSEAPGDMAYRMRASVDNHPIMLGLEAANADVGEMSFSSVLQVRPKTEAQEVLSFGRERPALVVTETAGRVAVITNPPDNSWGEFVTTSNPRRDPFLPLLHECIFFLSDRVATGLKTYGVGESVELRYPEGKTVVRMQVTPPHAEKPVAVSTQDESGHTIWLDTADPGFYKVEIQAGGQPINEGFAVNAPASESRMERLPLPAILDAEVIDAKDVKLMADPKEARWDGSEAGGRLPEYTPLVALLLLVLMTAEGFLGNRFYKGTAAGSGEQPEGGGEPSGKAG